MQAPSSSQMLYLVGGFHFRPLGATNVLRSFEKEKTFFNFNMKSCLFFNTFLEQNYLQYLKQNN